MLGARQLWKRAKRYLDKTWIKYIKSDIILGYSKFFKQLVSTKSKLVTGSCAQDSSVHLLWMKGELTVLHGLIQELHYITENLNSGYEIKVPELACWQLSTTKNTFKWKTIDRTGPWSDERRLAWLLYYKPHTHNIFFLSAFSWSNIDSQAKQSQDGCYQFDKLTRTVKKIRKFRGPFTVDLLRIRSVLRNTESLLLRKAEFSPPARIFRRHYFQCGQCLPKFLQVTRKVGNRLVVWNENENGVPPCSPSYIKLVSIGSW